MKRCQHPKILFVFLWFCLATAGPSTAVPVHDRASNPSAINPLCGSAPPIPQHLQAPAPPHHHEFDLVFTTNHMKGRYQLPVYAKFNRPDPMRDWDWLRPHTLNLYEYCGNDPVNGWDPTGFAPFGVLQEMAKNRPEPEIEFDPNDEFVRLGRQLGRRIHGLWETAQFVASYTLQSMDAVLLNDSVGGACSSFWQVQVDAFSPAADSLSDANDQFMEFTTQSIPDQFLGAFGTLQYYIGTPEGNADVLFDFALDRGLRSVVRAGVDLPQSGSGSWVEIHDAARLDANDILKAEKASGSGSGAKSGQHGRPYNAAARRLEELAKNPDLAPETRAVYLEKAKEFRTKARQVNHKVDGRGGKR